MEDINIISLARNYLGSKSIMDNTTEDRIEYLLNDIKSSVNPLHTYGIYDISIYNNIINFNNTIISVKSKDLSDLLKDSKQCIIIACTLGALVENKIRHYSKYNISDGILYDALAASYIEAYMDDINETLQNKYNFLTMRFSPGYGDLSLEVQNDILLVLKAQKIGLTVNENHLLIPRKSITAFIGIQDKPWKEETKLCDSCRFKNTCSLRKEGKFCGSKKFIK